MLSNITPCTHNTQTWDGHASGAAPQPVPISRLLGAAAALVLAFPARSYEVVVSVARKVGLSYAKLHATLCHWVLNESVAGICFIDSKQGSSCLSWQWLTCVDWQWHHRRLKASSKAAAAVDLAAAVPLFTFPGITCDARSYTHLQTDAALWPALFTAVGSPSALLQHLLESGALMSAGELLLHNLTVLARLVTAC